MGDHTFVFIPKTKVYIRSCAKSPMESEKYEYSAELAQEYDSLVRETEDHSHEIMFGLLFKYVKKDDTLLDLGIGTGLSSHLFHQMGLKIYGIDNSEEMLHVCKEKEIAEDLKLSDLGDTFPYDERKFDHIISAGVFHFFENLEHFFEESKRLLKRGGTLSFTVMYLKDDSVDVLERRIEGVPVFEHSQQYIERMMTKYGFHLLKSIEYQSYADPSKSRAITYKLFVLRR